jgi:hypothetical protein
MLVELERLLKLHAGLIWDPIEKRIKYGISRGFAVLY